MAAPETVKACLTNYFLSESIRGAMEEIWTVFVKEWHAGADTFELFEPDTSVVRDRVESLASLFGGGSARVACCG